MNPAPATQPTASYHLAEIVGIGCAVRVRVLEIVSPYDVRVVTADLRDAGTHLVLSPERIRPEPESAPLARHRSGLVALGGL